MTDKNQLTQDELNYKLTEYNNSVKFWTNNQLGYSINLFTTIGISFLSYIVSIMLDYF